MNHYQNSLKVNREPKHFIYIVFLIVDISLPRTKAADLWMNSIIQQKKIQFCGRRWFFRILIRWKKKILQEWAQENQSQTVDSPPLVINNANAIRWETRAAETETFRHIMLIPRRIRTNCCYRLCTKIQNQWTDYVAQRLTTPRLYSWGTWITWDCVTGSKVYASPGTFTNWNLCSKYATPRNVVILAKFSPRHWRFPGGVEICMNERLQSYLFCHSLFQFFYEQDSKILDTTMVNMPAWKGMILGFFIRLPSESINLSGLNANGSLKWRGSRWISLSSVTNMVPFWGQQATQVNAATI